MGITNVPNCGLLWVTWLFSGRFVVLLALMHGAILFADNVRSETTSDPVVSQSPGLESSSSLVTRRTEKPIQVFILLGQSNMVGLGKITGGPESLEAAVKDRQKYVYLVDADGNWSQRDDVHYVRVMDGRDGTMQILNKERLTVKTCKTIGPEFGIGHQLGEAVEAPVLLLKSCIGNRSLGWDLLPPGSERYAVEVKDKQGNMKSMVYAGYGDRPESWLMDVAQGLNTPAPPWLDKQGKPIDWYAGKQYDSDIRKAKEVLAELTQSLSQKGVEPLQRGLKTNDTIVSPPKGQTSFGITSEDYPDTNSYEIAGFFFWQGEKDCGNPGHALRYETNLVHFIKQLREEFKAPQAKFVLATLGEATEGMPGDGARVFAAHLAVDGENGKYPEFAGNVATVYTHPMAQGGSGNGHYGGKAEVYMDVGEAMGKAMVKLIHADKQ